jgi:hypothetical protein
MRRPTFVRNGVVSESARALDAEGGVRRRARPAEHAVVHGRTT